MRTLVDIPLEHVRRLDQIAKRDRRSRAAVIREAVADHVAKAKDTAWLDNAFGIWKDRTDIGDAVEWQRRERASWTRPWDDDYDEVRVEFPDLFDEADDAERAWHVARQQRKVL